MDIPWRKRSRKLTTKYNIGGANGISGAIERKIEKQIGEHKGWKQSQIRSIKPTSEEPRKKSFTVTQREASCLLSSKLVASGSKDLHKQARSRAKVCMP